MKPVDIKSSMYINSITKKVIEILNLKLVILLKRQNIKIFFQNVILQINLNNFL